MRLSSHASAEPVDWIRVKDSILSKLDLSAEYQALGLRFTASAPDAAGWRECRAMGRPDNKPSAAVNMKTGLYHDMGGGGCTLNFFDFALKYGSFGSWINTIQHFSKQTGVELGKVERRSEGRIRESTFFYRDAQGEVVYAVFRYRMPNGDKSFSQHPPDGRGGWRFGRGVMDGVKPVPYRLPELLSADRDEPVWIVEGEKCVERLVSEGFLSTSNHQGSDSTDKCWPHFLEYFKGRSCFVLPDNDDEGWKHARKVCAYLQPVAREVRLVELPGTYHHGDICDWLDLGHTVDELGKLAAHAPLFDPLAVPVVAESDPATLPDDKRVATLADLRRVVAGLSYLWPGWILNDALNVLAAPGGVGKTRLIADLWKRVADGTVWPDGQPIVIPDHLSSRKLFYIASDQNFSQLLDIFHRFDVPDELICLNSYASDPTSGLTFDYVADFDEFAKRVEQVKPTLIVIDTVSSATTTLKLSDMSDAAKLFNPLIAVAVKLRVPILGLMHLSRSGEVYGIRPIEKARTIIKLAADPENPESNRRRLWVDKSIGLKPDALGVTMSELGNDYDYDPPPIKVQIDPSGFGKSASAISSPAFEAAKAFILIELRIGPRRLSALLDDSLEKGIAKGTFFRVRDKLIADGEILQDEVSGDNGKNYKWLRLNADGATDPDPDAPAF